QGEDAVPERADQFAIGFPVAGLGPFNQKRHLVPAHDWVPVPIPVCGTRPVPESRHGLVLCKLVRAAGFGGSPPWISKGDRRLQRPSAGNPKSQIRKVNLSDFEFLI